MKAKSVVASLLVLLSLFAVNRSMAYVVDFEGLSDLESVTNQYGGLGVIFSNALVLTAGISLNEFEFPPHSGTNVVSDDAGPMTLSFSVPVLSAGSYFTYSTSLTLSFFDTLDNPVGSASSQYASNPALSGDPGSTPNEFLSFVSVSGIATLVITGDPLGGSFTMDDLTVTTATPVPEPATLFVLGCGLLGIAGYKLRRR